MMRTTLDIDDDVLAIARRDAQRRRTSLGATVSAMMRRGLPEPIHFEISPNGVPHLPRRPGSVPVPVTVEMVNRLRDEFE